MEASHGDETVGLGRTTLEVEGEPYGAAKTLSDEEKRELEALGVARVEYGEGGQVRLLFPDSVEAISAVRIALAFNNLTSGRWEANGAFGHACYPEQGPDGETPTGMIVIEDTAKY